MQTTSFNKLESGGLRKAPSLADLTAAAATARAEVGRVKMQGGSRRAIADAESELAYRSRLLANARTTGARAAGAGASSSPARTKSPALVRRWPGGDPRGNSDLSRLSAAAKAAMVEIDDATKSGNQNRIGAAKAELQIIKRRLDDAERDLAQTKAVKAVLRRPITR